MTQADSVGLSAGEKNFFIRTDSTESFDQDVLHCSITLLAKLVCENVVCYAEYRSIADRYVSFEYLSVRPQLITNFRIRLIRLIAFENRPPSERLFNEVFMADFVSIYNDLVSQRTKYLDPYYGEAKPLGPQGVQGVLRAERSDPEEVPTTASILCETNSDPQNGGVTNTWDNLTHLSTELLAWMISQHIECTLEDRRLSDWLAAEKRVLDSKLLIIAILQATYSPIPFGISREIFNSRCAEIITHELEAIVQDRATYLGPEYGIVKTTFLP